MLRPVLLTLHFEYMTLKGLTYDEENRGGKVNPDKQVVLRWMFWFERKQKKSEVSSRNSDAELMIKKNLHSVSLISITEKTSTTQSRSDAVFGGA